MATVHPVGWAATAAQKRYYVYGCKHDVHVPPATHAVGASHAVGARPGSGALLQMRGRLPPAHEIEQRFLCRAATFKTLWEMV
ncbi:hypothetical protein PoB_001030700 [Plakobranchus ocellatus]|uniref:Uncharacterized protein n=1 Tax=Plakobranchus ocellatus TaxID=259542 RepID=A0AAV3YN11_9GAST|nr:hypothetical protein PoB_001030700 [Plakobranchus ocellatus]